MNIDFTIFFNLQNFQSGERLVNLERGGESALLVFLYYSFMGEWVCDNFDCLSPWIAGIKKLENVFTFAEIL